MPFIPDEEFTSGFVPDAQPEQQQPGLLSRVGSALGGVGQKVQNVGGFFGEQFGIPTLAAKGVGQAASGFAGLTGNRALQQRADQYTPTGKQTAGAFGKLALGTATLGTSGVTRGLLGRTLESAATGAGFQASQNLESGEDVGFKTGAVVGAMFPIAGALLTKVAGPVLAGVGAKIQRSVLKPTAADIKDGFDVANVNKYGLGGGLQKTLDKARAKVAELTAQLNEKIGRGSPLDLGAVLKRTETELSGSKTKNFGNINPVKRILNSLKGEIDEVSPTGVLSLPDAQDVKQAAGMKGAWVYGNADPDATAIERVYTAFYRNLRQEIEDRAPAGVREINRQISEIVPIIHAAFRRIPVAERNNALGAGELLSAGLGLAKGIGPGVVLGGANLISKSGVAGAALSKVGSVLKNIKPASNIGRRIFGR